LKESYICGLKIYYLCPDWEPPAGGIRIIYRHVDILRRNGFDAFVVHERQGFRCRWFENDTPVLGWTRRRYGKDSALPQRAGRYVRRGMRRAATDRPFLHLQEQPSFAFEPDDVVVIPEVFGPRLADIAPGTPKVICNLSVYFTFKGYPTDPRTIDFPHRHPEVVAVFTLSEDSRRFVEYAFPATRTHRVSPGIDPQRFHPSEEKLRRISFMPRRSALDAVHVLATVAARGALDDYEIMPIDGLDEDGVAACLRKSLIFLSLGYHEGFGLPPAEAMACGAIVVGYDAFAGREYLVPELAFPVPVGDLMRFSETLERVLRLLKQRPDDLRAGGLRAAAFVAENYSPQREENELLAAWNDVFRLVKS
jgi:glycosyltransferase involved in cell wall biosynthesis